MPEILCDTVCQRVGEQSQSERRGFHGVSDVFGSKTLGKPSAGAPMGAMVGLMTHAISNATDRTAYFDRPSSVRMMPTPAIPIAMRIVPSMAASSQMRASPNNATETQTGIM